MRSRPGRPLPPSSSEWPDVLVVRPRSGGVRAGRVFVLPRVHVEDAGTDWEVTVASW
ncbi:hypothetical protein [Streptomyces sp. SudanB91_2054]|uniref:hypothetical protein n=1 Tax=Streptomyces sp. SudanB91_2054 TaxID=3035278 RepID=UPI0036DE2C37